MKQYYVSVLSKEKYKYLTGNPYRSIMLVDDKQNAEKYDEANKNYFLNIFEPNDTNVRVETADD